MRKALAKVFPDSVGVQHSLTEWYRYKFEPDDGIVAIHGVAAHDSRGRIVADFGGHLFRALDFLWDKEILWICITEDNLLNE
jgi:hypothetical protein